MQNSFCCCAALRIVKHHAFEPFGGLFPGGVGICGPAFPPKDQIAVAAVDCIIFQTDCPEGGGDLLPANLVSLFCRLRLLVKKYWQPVFVKGKLLILTVNLRNGPRGNPALHFDVFQPLIGKGAEIVPQLRIPSAWLRVNLLIDLRPAVLPEGQRLQRSPCRIQAEGHFRVIHQIAVLLIGMGYGNLVLTDPLERQRHQAAAFSAPQFHKPILAADKLREQPRKGTVVALHPRLPRKPGRFRRSLYRRCRPFLLGDPLRVCHDLLNKGVPIQRLRVRHLTVHDPGLGQMLPNCHRVHVVHSVIFFLREELLSLDKLGDPPLDFRPRQDKLLTGLVSPPG